MGSPKTKGGAGRQSRERRDKNKHEQGRRNTWGNHKQATKQGSKQATKQGTKQATKHANLNRCGRGERKNVVLWSRPFVNLSSPILKANNSTPSSVTSWVVELFCFFLLSLSMMFQASRFSASGRKMPLEPHRSEACRSCQPMHVLSFGEGRNLFVVVSQQGSATRVWYAKSFPWKRLSFL